MGLITCPAPNCGAQFSESSDCCPKCNHLIRKASQKFLREELIKHLSTEIMVLTQLATTFRSRIAFLTWVGPLIVLGSVVIATRGAFKPNMADPLFLPSIALLLMVYLVLGYVAARIEQFAWYRCDIYRRAIVQIAKDGGLTELESKELRPRWYDTLLAILSRGKIKPDSNRITVYNSSERLAEMYLWAFLLIFLSSLSLAYLAINLSANLTPEKNREAGNVSVIK